ncbi:MAG: TlyA family RNA methyltransferase [Firmicutes bacterium]|nr:TlyA family RNA methyltransferase [Bacillota bacterium]
MLSLLWKGYVKNLKERLDTLLVRQGYYESREKAKRAIMAGIVFVNGQKSDKAGNMIDTEAEIFVKENICPYVSRGGLKLEKSIKMFNLDLTDDVCMDIGASTGGFTDCMLQNGAVRVYAVDVGYGQLDWKLRNDERVVNMEKCNVRYLDPETIAEPVDFISIDVSFISLKLIFPVAAQLLADDGHIVCLVKPQFEAGREQVGKKGIVRDRKVHEEVIENVIKYAADNGLYPHGLTFSPVTGAKGNIEYLLYLSKQEDISYNEAVIRETVDSSHRELE